MESVRRVQVVYFSLQFLFWFATALPAALGVLIVQSRGLSLSQIGLLLGVYSVTIMALEVPTGGLADAVGRKPVTLLAYGVTIVGAAAYLVAWEFPVFLLVFALNGAGRALSTGALDAWFVDTLQELEPDIDLQPVFARGGIVALSALALGTLTGSLLPYLFAWLPPEGTALLTPFSTTLVASFLVHVLSFTGVVLLVNEPRSNRRGWLDGFRQTPAIVQSAARLAQQTPTLRRLMSATMVGGLALISLELLWQPHFAGMIGDVEGNSILFGVIMAGSFLAGAVGNGLAIPLKRRLGDRDALLAACFQALRGVALLLLALQGGLYTAVACFWLVYLNTGVVNSPHAALYNRAAPAAQRSTLLSLDSLIGYVGCFIGSVGLGFVAEQRSIPLAWTLAGLILLGSTLIYLRLNSTSEVSNRVAVPVFEND